MPPMPPRSKELESRMDRFFAELHSHLVIMGMGHKSDYNEMGNMPAMDMIQTCFQNNVTLDIRFTNRTVLPKSESEHEVRTKK